MKKREKSQKTKNWIEILSFRLSMLVGTVQIEYFTCADTSMRTSEWCAYNIVIPVMAPYDDKKYSTPLREKFCWTLPQFYSVPILDKSYNEADREFIYNLVSDIRSAMRTHFFPSKYHDTLIKMINICGCLMSLLKTKMLSICN